MALAEIRDAVELGLKIVSYLRNSENDQQTEDIIESLHEIYFSKSTIDLLRGLVNATEEERIDGIRRISRRLLDTRYSVHHSLGVLDNKEFNEKLSLREQRLLEFIYWGEKSIRAKLFSYFEEAQENFNSDRAAELVAGIERLNEAVEDIEERLLQRKRSRNG